jgi:hypothetical protein
MPTTPQKKLEIVKRRQQVAEFYLQSWTQAAIAEHLGLDQSTISDDLRAIRRDWRESTIRDFDLAQAEELQKTDRIEREAWAAWQRSQKPAQSAVMNGDGAGGATRKSVKNRDGDPRMLDLVLKCGVARRNLLGLDAPTRIAPVTPDGRNPYRLAVAQLSLDELRALKNVQTRILELNAEEENGQPEPESGHD